MNKKFSSPNIHAVCLTNEGYGFLAIPRDEFLQVATVWSQQKGASLKDAITFFERPISESGVGNRITPDSIYLEEEDAAPQFLAMLSETQMVPLCDEDGNLPVRSAGPAVWHALPFQSDVVIHGLVDAVLLMKTDREMTVIGTDRLMSADVVGDDVDLSDDPSGYILADEKGKLVFMPAAEMTLLSELRRLPERDFRKDVELKAFDPRGPSRDIGI